MFNDVRGIVGNQDCCIQIYSVLFCLTSQHSKTKNLLSLLILEIYFRTESGN